MRSPTTAGTISLATSRRGRTTSPCRRGRGTRSIPTPARRRPIRRTPARVAEERAQLDVAYPMTFYPAAEDSSGASAIMLHPGDRATADVAMRAVPAVHLRVGLRRCGRQELQQYAARGFPRVSQRIFEGTLVPVMSAQGFGLQRGSVRIHRHRPRALRGRDARSRLKAQWRWLVQGDGPFRHGRARCPREPAAGLGHRRLDAGRRARGQAGRSMWFSSTALRAKTFPPK